MLTPGTAVRAPATILAVDDEANILTALKRVFRADGYRVLTAPGGAEGLALLEHEPVDVVISDMRMPGMDGAQFLSAASERWPDAVRILLTGYSDMSATIAAVNGAGLYRYLTKPWNEVELRDAVRGGLERKRLVEDKLALEAFARAQNDELKRVNAGLEAAVAARTAELARALAKVKESFVTSLRVFSGLAEMREGRASGHARRVAELAHAIARKLALADEHSQEVMIAGLLHDIGKIGLSDALLRTPWPQLEPAERTLAEAHAAKGAALLMGLDALAGAARLVRSHHERFDGRGFPDRLRGEMIPLGARILAVADEFDGAQTGMLLGKRLSPEDALRYVTLGAGTRSDQGVVQALALVLHDRHAADRHAPRMLAAAQLAPGMRLAADLHSRAGVLLLAAGQQLNSAQIAQLKELEHAEAHVLAVSVTAAPSHAAA